MAESAQVILTYEDLQNLCRPGSEQRRPRRATVEAWAKRELNPAYADIARQRLHGKSAGLALGAA